MDAFRRLLFLLLLLFGQSGFAAHGIAQFGELKYPRGFAHFDYVNPSAPKQGALILSPVQQTGFDKFNPFSLKGRTAPGVDFLMFESLAVSSSDEVASVYGLLADDMSVAADRLSASFHINPQARFSNGRAVLAQDVKDSFDTLVGKLANPGYRFIYGDVARAVVVAERVVRFEFRRPNAELPLLVATMPVFAREWGQRADGGSVSFDKLGFESPVGSGPYLIEKFDAGRSITFRRNPDWWARDLNVRRGMFNFERVVFQIYKDDTAQLEAFKAGNFDVSFEYRAKNWARGYQGPKFRSGELIRREFPHHNGGDMQGFVMNLRRPLFADVRVRQALALALDFDWMNRQLFFGQYARLNSYYTDTELAAIDTPGSLPGPDELKLLEPLRGQLSPAVFQPLEPPASTVPPHSLRDNLRRAQSLLAQAGWTYRDGALRNAKGDPFEFEMLDNHVLTRVDVAYARNLERLGIRVVQRDVDAALFKKRLEDFDFDMTHCAFSASHSPGNELGDRFTSSSADEKGSDNLIGLRSPAVDTLIHRLLQATDRPAQVAAARALDRVLTSGYYLIPHWFSRSHRIAYRRGLGIPPVLPRYYSSENWVMSTWWQEN